ncbi:hypothetical protein ACJMK2_037652 [Sinanodonta woodiana]|uniref:Uncharacterized protein n=1 Tax=Sinanodonta woodiana TaxID=1069815 RepID=A0ABD3WL27_SINWO
MATSLKKYDDTNDTIMQEIEEQAARKKMEEEALQARLKKMDALERQNEKKKRREEKKKKKKQQRCETQKKASERKMEELNDITDNGTSTFPQQKSDVSNLQTDKESNTNTNVIHASRPSVINKEPKSGILLQHFAPNYVLTGTKTESQSSSLEKQFNIGGKSSMMLLDSPDKEDPTTASCMQHYMKELMQVQPAQHTEQQLKVEHEWLHLEQIQKDQEELERLQEKPDDNIKALGCRSVEGSVLLSEFIDEKKLEKLRLEHLQKMRHLEHLRNQEEAYEIQQSRLQQLRQQKAKQEATKLYRTPGNEAAVPVLDGRMNMHEKKQEKLEEILPNPEEMLKQAALKPGKLTAKDDKERLNKHVAKKGESNTTRKTIPPRSTLVPPIKLQDLGGLQSIWDIEVSKPSPSFASTSVSHNPASQFSHTYAEAIKPKSTSPSWTLPSSPPSTSSLSLQPSPMNAELIKLKTISPDSCPSLTSHSAGRQQSMDQYQSEIHSITTCENQRGHLALNCNNSASSPVESTSKMGSWTRKPWEPHHKQVVSVMPPSTVCNGEKLYSEQPYVPLTPQGFVLGNQQHQDHQGCTPLMPPSSFSSQQQGCHQRPISSQLPYFIHARQNQEEGTQIYSDKNVSKASVRVDAWNPSLDKIHDSHIHKISMTTGSSTKFSPSFCGKQPEYFVKQEPFPQKKEQTAVEHHSKVERQKVICQSFCKANAIVIPTVQNLQHGMEVDMQSTKVGDDLKKIEEDWDAEADEVIAKRKPFIEDMGNGKKKLWSCYSIKQEKIIYPCSKDFASSIHEFKVRKEKQKLELGGVEPNNAEHESELCKREDLIKGSSVFGFSYCGSASASRRVKAVGKGGFKQRQSNRNTSELNKIQNRMHENKECGMVTLSSTKSEFKRFPKESSIPARETNKLDRNKLNKNTSSSYCDTTDPGLHAISTFSSQEPGTIPPSVQQNNLPTKQSPLKQSGKPIPQTESWDDEIDSVPYIQVDVAPKEVISNGEYLNQDMLANQFNCILSMEDALSKTINNMTTAQEMHDWLTKHKGASFENKRFDTKIEHADVTSRFQFKMENKNCSLLESHQILPLHNFVADEKMDKLSPIRLPHFSKFLNMTSAMPLGPGFTTTEPKSTGPEFIEMNSVVREPSKDQTSEFKTPNDQTDSITILEETETTKGSEANCRNPLPSGLPPHMVQAYSQYVALTSFNSMNMAPACLMPGMWSDLGMVCSPFCPNMWMYPHISVLDPLMPMMSPEFSNSQPQQLQHQQRVGSVNEESNNSQLTEIDAKSCPLMLSDKVREGKEISNTRVSHIAIICLKAVGVLSIVCLIGQKLVHDSCLR